MLSSRELPDSMFTPDSLHVCWGRELGGFPLTQPAFYLRRCSLQLLHYLDKREHFISLRVVANKYLTAAQEDVRKLDRVLLKGSVLLTGKQRVLREFKHEDIKIIVFMNRIYFQSLTHLKHADDIRML